MTRDLGNKIKVMNIYSFIKGFPNDKVYVLVWSKSGHLLRRYSVDMVLYNVITLVTLYLC